MDYHLIELWRDLGYKVGAEIGVERGKYAFNMFYDFQIYD